MIKTWGFLFRPIGSIDSSQRLLILIGYPIDFVAAPVVPVVTVVSQIESLEDLIYYRSYLLDLQLVRPRHMVPAFLEPADVEISADLDYFRSYLGRV